jgi:esterase/lipase superfamily enzyme
MSSIPRREGPDYTRVVVRFGTNRSVLAASAPPAERFANEGSGMVHYGRAEVSIPRDHRMGELESPALWRLEFREDPTRHVVLLRVDEQDRASFLADLQAAVGQAEAAKALVFVHGYNVSFEDAARRTAQIAYDIAFPGVPLFYSWPSSASLLGYRDDERAIAASEPLIKAFFADLAEQAGTDQIYVLAHSMGTRATAAALAGLFSERPELRGRFRHIMLMAPDLDAKVFKENLAPALIEAQGKVTLYASVNDAALKASRYLHGAMRLGEADPIVIIPGMESVDASNVHTELLGHSYYADGDSVVADLIEVVSEKGPAEQRSWLETITSVAGRFFRFRPVPGKPSPPLGPEGAPGP